MSSSSEALVAEVQQQQKQESTFEADLSSANTTEPPPTTTVIPAIQFHRTLYLDADGRPSPDNAPNNGGLRIHDVLSVPEDSAPCTLSSILPLLSYHRLEEAFVCLNAQGVLRATTPTLEVLSRRRSLSQGRRSLAAAACLLVAHRGQLYGVQVDEGGVAKVVGTVRQVVSSWSQGGEHKDLEDDADDEGQTESCLVLDGTVVGKVVRLGSVTFDPAHHVLVTVPLGGRCFAQLSKGTTAAADDKNEGEGEEGEYSTPLALLIGPAHILFTSTITLKWNAYVDSSMKEMVTKAVPPGSTFFQSSGGWWTAQTDPSVVEKEVDSMETPTTTTTTYLMTGLGMRKCHFQEAFFYAQMHIGQTIKQKVIEKEEEENKEEDK